MERYEYLSKVKKEQKELAKYIKELKSKRKADRRDGWSLLSPKQNGHTTLQPFYAMMAILLSSVVTNMDMLATQ